MSRKILQPPRLTSTPRPCRNTLSLLENFNEVSPILPVLDMVRKTKSMNTQEYLSPTPVKKPKSMIPLVSKQSSTRIRSNNGSSNVTTRTQNAVVTDNTGQPQINDQQMAQTQTAAETNSREKVVKGSLDDSVTISSQDPKHEHEKISLRITAKVPIESAIQRLSQVHKVALENNARNSINEGDTQIKSQHTSKFSQRPSTLHSNPEASFYDKACHLHKVSSDENILKSPVKTQVWQVTVTSKKKVSLKRKSSVPQAAMKKLKSVPTLQETNESLFESPTLPNLIETSSLSNKRKTYVLKKKKKEENNLEKTYVEDELQEIVPADIPQGGAVGPKGYSDHLSKRRMEETSNKTYIRVKEREAMQISTLDKAKRNKPEIKEIDQAISTDPQTIQTDVTDKKGTITKRPRRQLKQSDNIECSYSKNKSSVNSVVEQKTRKKVIGSRGKKTQKKSENQEDIEEDDATDCKHIENQKKNPGIKDIISQLLRKGEESDINSIAEDVASKRITKRKRYQKENQGLEINKGIIAECETNKNKISSKQLTETKEPLRKRKQNTNSKTITKEEQIKNNDNLLDSEVSLERKVSKRKANQKVRPSNNGNSKDKDDPPVEGNANSVKRKTRACTNKKQNVLKTQEIDLMVTERVEILENITDDKIKQIRKKSKRDLVSDDVIKKSLTHKQTSDDCGVSSKFETDNNNITNSSKKQTHVAENPVKQLNEQNSQPSSEIQEQIDKENKKPAANTSKIGDSKNNDKKVCVLKNNNRKSESLTLKRTSPVTTNVNEINHEIVNSHDQKYINRKNDSNKLIDKKRLNLAQGKTTSFEDQNNIEPAVTVPEPKIRHKSIKNKTAMKDCDVGSVIMKCSEQDTVINYPLHSERTNIEVVADREKIRQKTNLEKRISESHSKSNVHNNEEGIVKQSRITETVNSPLLLPRKTNQVSDKKNVAVKEINIEPSTKKSCKYGDSTTDPSHTESRFYFRKKQPPVAFWRVKKHSIYEDKNESSTIPQSKQSRKNNRQLEKKDNIVKERFVNSASSELDQSQQNSFLRGNKQIYYVAELFGLNRVKVQEIQPGVVVQTCLHINDFVMTGIVKLETGASITKVTTNTTYIVIEGTATVRISNQTNTCRAGDNNCGFFIPKNIDVSITNEDSALLRMAFTKFKNNP